MRNSSSAGVREGREMKSENQEELGSWVERDVGYAGSGKPRGTSDGGGTSGALMVHSIAFVSGLSSGQNFSYLAFSSVSSFLRNSSWKSASSELLG